MKNKDSFPLWRQSVALLLANLFVILTVQAQQSTWVAGAMNATLWSKNGNWSPLGAIPNTNSAIAIFGPVSKPPLVDVDMNFNAGEVRFVTNAPAYTITVDAGQSLSLHGAGITNQSAKTQTFVNDGILQINSTGTADTSVSITNNSRLRFTDRSKAGSAIITTNTGGSTLFLGASSGDQAQFITNAGGLVDISALTTAGTTAGSIAGVGTYNLGSKEFTVGSNSLSTIVSGLIEGTGGSLDKVGTGTLELDGDNTYSGGTFFFGGILAVKSDSNLGTGPLNFNGGVLEALASGGGITSSKPVTLNAPGGGAFFADPGTTSVLSGVISGDGSLSKRGPGSLTLLGDNTYSGGTGIGNGTLVVGTLDQTSEVSTALGTGGVILEGVLRTTSFETGKPLTIIVGGNYTQRAERYACAWDRRS